MKRTATAIIVIITGLGLAQAFAQGKKKKPVVQQTQTNVAVAAPTDTLVDSFGERQYVMDTSTTTRYFLLPEFYSYWPVTKGDTVIKYQCYDAENSYINIDTLSDIGEVKHIHLMKVFTNYLHTYIDAEGKPKPSTAAKTIFRYDKIDNNTWKSYDYGSTWVSELKENREEIIKQDTTTFVNAVTGGKRLTIRKYYKVTELKHKGEIDTDTEK